MVLDLSRSRHSLRGRLERWQKWRPISLQHHATRCDALVIFPDDKLSSIALPELTEDRALKLRSLWARRLDACNGRERSMMPASDAHSHAMYLSRLLGLAWKWVVRPILQSVGLVSALQHDDHFTQY